MLSVNVCSNIYSIVFKLAVIQITYYAFVKLSVTHNAVYYTLLKLSDTYHILYSTILKLPKA